MRINLSGTVSATDVGPIGFSSVLGPARGDDGVMYGVSGNQIITIDTSTGQGTLKSNYGGQNLGDAYGASFVAEAIPEPSIHHIDVHRRHRCSNIRTAAAKAAI